MNKDIMPLPVIPVIEDCRSPAELFLKERARAKGMIDAARKSFGGTLLEVAGYISRWWLGRACPPYHNEIDMVAQETGHRSIYTLNLSYEWGCTTTATPDPEGKGVRLFRTLDWPMKDMGDQIVLARHEGAAGPYWNMAYPGFIGVIQGLATGRFAIAINQAPVHDFGVGLAGGWILSRIRMHKSTDMPATILLRKVFEECADYKAAVKMLTETPLCVPAIFVVTGTKAGEQAIVERECRQAVIHQNAAALCAGNHWLNDQWKGLVRPTQTHERVAHMNRHLPHRQGNFDWVEPPVLNVRTRLAFEANAATGRLKLRGWEDCRPATALLSLVCK